MTVMVTGSVVVLAISMNPLYDEAVSTKNHGPFSAVSTILKRKLRVADGTGAGRAGLPPMGAPVRLEA